MDAEGDLDLVVGTWNNGVFLYRNEGTAEARLRARRRAARRPVARQPRLARPGRHRGDGDLDIVAGESSGEVNVWRNDGTAAAPSFTLVTDTLMAIDVGRRSAPALADLNGDGRADSSWDRRAARRVSCGERASWTASTTQGRSRCPASLRPRSRTSMATGTWTSSSGRSRAASAGTRTREIVRRDISGGS